MKIKGYQQTAPQQVVVDLGAETMTYYGVTDNIIRVVYRAEAAAGESPLGLSAPAGVPLKVAEKAGKLLICSRHLTVILDRQTARATYVDRATQHKLLHESGRELRKTPRIEYTLQGAEPVTHTVKTVDGERNFIENLIPEETGFLYKGRVLFEFAEGEQIHGLGQGEEGIYDYRNNVQYLYQHNMRIPMPVMVSSAGYGLLFDAACLMTFNDDRRGSYIYLDAVQQLDYYIIAGNLDEVVKGYRRLTGKAVMLPKYAYGFVQSKEAYHTQDEILEVAGEYRQRHLPLDLIVQDWNTWEDGKWGNKIVDKKRYPDLAQMNEQLHAMHVHSMVSIWPNSNQGSENFDELKAGGYLLNDFSTYNAFDEEARQTYWRQANEELFAGGFDSWWCDSTEPFTGTDWNGQYRREPWERFELVGEEHKKFLGAEWANLFAVKHAQGIYENQRRENPAKRVLNLTRSGYATSQKYGTMLWSGDTAATWQTLRDQITEGLNMAMSGIPYWTLDIGGFFTVNENWQARGCNCNTVSDPKWFWQGDYEQGVKDLGYRELYVRWFELGAFLPMFRSHGTDTPREIWNFGQPGEPFYEAIAETMRRRYRLMPYIYSLAGGVWHRDQTIMRSLLFDFAGDQTAAGLSSQYMFGPALLICPVTRPMFFDRDSRPLDGPDRWQVYLPAGTDWYCFYTGQRYRGGRWLETNAPLNRIPVFVKAGAIIPQEAELDYADQAVETPLEFHIYPGADGTFAYYEDEGDGYGYEQGVFNEIPLTWRDASQTLVIGAADCQFAGSLAGRKCVAIAGNEKREFTYQGERIEISFN